MSGPKSLVVTSDRKTQTGVEMQADIYTCTAHLNSKCVTRAVLCRRPACEPVVIPLSSVVQPLAVTEKLPWDSGEVPEPCTRLCGGAGQGRVCNQDLRPVLLAVRRALHDRGRPEEAADSQPRPELQRPAGRPLQELRDRRPHQLLRQVRSGSSCAAALASPWGVGFGTPRPPKSRCPGPSRKMAPHVHVTPRCSVRRVVRGQ